MYEYFDEYTSTPLIALPQVNVSVALWVHVQGFFPQENAVLDTVPKGLNPSLGNSHGELW
jgi:hypothetical protein